ncbi:ring finger protein [Reticulomyxa filosa]|uniref:Ring finger protein n=1 Tax=Reticulomyxa filosa TaxID=46433 RepID=X6LDH6_RETFI|nr:ring finger protein [Reticulomyxa filosa]|eukprot:ETN99390.1 ring finger protein [Reticulomyxa filosa]
MQDCEDKKSELFEKVIRTMENGVPKVEELNKENVGAESKKLYLNLNYCFKCELWFKRNNPMRESLFTFLNKVLTNLTKNENLLPIHVYKHLVTHLKDIKKLSSHLTKLVERPQKLVEMIQRLEEMVKEYQQFSKLIDMFKQVHNDFSIEDLPVQLKKLETESENWEVQGFIKTRNRYDQEIKLLKEHEQSMNIMVDRRDSVIFHEIWKKHKTGHQSSKNSKLLFIFDRMFQDSNKKWEDFKQDLQNGTIKYKDLEWMSIAKSNETDHIMKRLEDEMKYLFPRLNDEERKSIVNDVRIKIKKKMDLKEQLQPWIELKEVTERIKEYYPCKDEIKEDEVKEAEKKENKINEDDQWKAFVKALEKMEEITRTSEDISIKEAAECYDTCFECVGEGAKVCMETGLFKILIDCENQLKILASNTNFTNEKEFKEILHVLRENSHQDLQNLASSLECVNPVMQKLWKSNNMTDLAKAILSLSSNGQNFVEMLKKCCDTNLANIPSLVNEDNKAQIEKNMKQFKEAKTYGEWKFGTCEDMLQGNKNSELILEIVNTTWHYHEIAEKIDRVLLGVRKSELNEIEYIIGQFEECKEISAARIEFWKQGGRIHNANGEDIISASSQMNVFTNCKKIWKQRLTKWKQCYLQLRELFPALNYFRFNEIHSLIRQIDTLSSSNNRSLQEQKSIKLFLQKVKCEVTDEDVDKILQHWRNFDFDVLESYHMYDISEKEGFKECRDNIAKFGQILRPLWTYTIEKTYPIELNVGKPNLILSQDKLLLFKVLSLFESRPCIPRAEHILICNEKTMEEDVACLIFRAITNDIQMRTDMHHDSVKPLYCLIYPEELIFATLEQVCRVVHDLLLNDVQLEKLKNCFYLFTVISSDAENPLCKLLEPFHVSFPNISSQEFPKKMLSQLYRNSWTGAQSYDINIEPPWIQLYTSKRVGMGKSRVIQRDIEKIRSIHSQKDKTVKDVCVAFNGKDIDWEQTMKSLRSYYPCPDNSLIIYHLNISSCVSTQINDFLFQLLFLQHIGSNSQISQCFHVNSNMIFLIEIPSTLDDLSFDESIPNFFYLFFSVVQFPVMQVSSQNNPFEFEMEAQQVIKWARPYFDKNTRYFCIFTVFFKKIREFFLV